jgi:hypothetical protein
MRAKNSETPKTFQECGQKGLTQQPQKSTQL